MAAKKRKRAAKVSSKPAAPRKAGKAQPTEPQRRRFSGYSPDAIGFLVELAANNDRDWFHANQDRYESVIREPSLEFIAGMRPRVHEISAHIAVIDKKVGGSLLRPQRDTRFSANAEPYKTNVGVYFRHAAGKDIHAPGMYFHFDADEVFVGVGMWHPDAEALGKVRKRIVAKPDVYRRSIGSASFKRYFTLGGESLRRAPKGYAEEHPMIEALKRKDHIAVGSLPPGALHKAALLKEVGDRFAAAADFLRFLNGALGLPF